MNTLYSFCSQSGCTDGQTARAGLVQASNGNFYGTTLIGGHGAHDCSTACGTVFKITPSGTLTTLYSFCSHSGCTDGAEPQAALVQATDGNFYGTTFYGGANGYGANPAAGLVQATNGNFYGTTVNGGANGYGTVFSLSVGLGPFVETQPTSGKVGAAVKILGTNLTGATASALTAPRLSLKWSRLA